MDEATQSQTLKQAEDNSRVRKKNTIKIMVATSLRKTINFKLEKNNTSLIEEKSKPAPDSAV